MVEDIVEFPPKSENALFISKNEIAEQRRVEIASSAGPHGVFRSIADIAFAGKGDARGIEESINGLCGACEIGVTREVHTLPIGSATTT